MKKNPQNVDPPACPRSRNISPHLERQGREIGEVDQPARRIARGRLDPSHAGFSAMAAFDIVVITTYGNTLLASWSAGAARITT